MHAIDTFVWHSNDPHHLRGENALGRNLKEMGFEDLFQCRVLCRILVNVVMNLPVPDNQGVPQQNSYYFSPTIRYRKPIVMVVGTCCTDHTTPLYLQKLEQSSPASGGCSVGTVNLQAESHGIYLFFLRFFTTYFGLHGHHQALKR
jgi:hypothetical protein